MISRYHKLTTMLYCRQNFMYVKGEWVCVWLCVCVCMCVRVCECVCVYVCVYIHMRALLFFIEMTIHTTNFKKQQSPGTYYGCQGYKESNN